MVSHIIATHPVKDRVLFDPGSALQASNLKRNCVRHDVALFDTNDALQGIEHIIAPEHGMVRPGMGVICGDSHTTTYGARGFAVEFCGHAIEALSLEARLTLCNMAVEAGARGALIAPDRAAIDYVLARAPDIDESLRTRALVHWATLHSDEAAAFDVEHHLDAAEVAPLRDLGHQPRSGDRDHWHRSRSERATAREHPAGDALHRPGRRHAAGMPLEGLAVDHVFIGSCTNARIEGIAQVLIDAGFEWRQPGCSMCLAMNDEVLEAGQRCASTTNRNFEGRQGRGAITHPMSPAMAAAAAAAAAVTGHITDVRQLGASS